MATIREAAVELMKHLCNDDRHGYYRGARPTGVNEAVDVLGKTVYIDTGDYDCSTSILTVYRALGVDCGGASWTGNMHACMCGDGMPFKWHEWDDEYVMRPGDLAIQEGVHVAMCVADDFTIAEFWPANGDFDEDEGDQGGEGIIRGFHNMVAWNGCLELKDSIGNRTWSGSATGGGTTGGSTSISSMQSILNGKLSAFGLSGVSLTGSYDTQTQKGLVRLLQASQNYDFGCGLAVDGYIGAATAAAMDAHPVGSGGETQGNDCWAVKAMLVGNGWELDLSHWYIQQAELDAIAGHKPYHGLPATPVCDGATLRSLATAVSV